MTAPNEQSNLHVWPPEIKDRVELLERLVLMLITRTAALERAVSALVRPPEPAPEPTTEELTEA